MADSPTRRSSIPILKQTNKTKSFQSYVSLNLSDDMNQQQKSRSSSSMSSMSPPILDNPKMPPKPPARSMNQVPRLEIDNDIIITKLCDENKRLKEHQTQLVSKYEEGEFTRDYFVVTHLKSSTLNRTINSTFSSKREHGNSEQKWSAAKRAHSSKTWSIRKSLLAKNCWKVGWSEASFTVTRFFWPVSFASI